MPGMGGELQGSCMMGRRAQDRLVGFRAGGEREETKKKGGHGPRSREEA